MPHTQYISGKKQIEPIVKERYPATVFYHGFSKVIAIIASGFWVLTAIGSLVGAGGGKGAGVAVLAFLICGVLAVFSYFITMLAAEYFLAIARMECNTNKGLSGAKPVEDKKAA